MHSFTSDPARGVIEITVAGFWTLEEFGEFTRALQHHIRMWPGSTPPMSLYNYTDAAIQSQDVVAAMQHLASTVDPHRRVALYTEGRLARMQARRVAMAGSQMRVFDSREEAIEWLTSKPTAQSATIAA